VRLIFVRHGETDFNVERRYQGHTDSELSERGRQQAVSVAKRLGAEPITAVYASDLRRASETARIIADVHDLQVCTDARLRECSFGDWEGLSVEEIQERYPKQYENYRQDSVTYRAPNGETLQSLMARVVSAVEEITARHEDGHIVIVGHGGTVNSFICHALGAQLSIFRRIRLDNCGLTIFHREQGGRWVLEVLNDTCHLENQGQHS